MSDFWTLYWGFASFIFGAIVGSFLNVCIWRLPRGESLSHPPSHCPRCDHRLKIVPDMVPLFTQLLRRSRCRYCGARFSWRYFWVELFTALAFVAIYVRYAVHASPHLSELARTGSALAGMVYAAGLITIFFIDLEHYQIPDLAVLVAFLAALGKDILLISQDARPLWQPVWGTPWQIPLPLSILGALVAFWLLWQFAALATAVLGKEAMGAGDSLLLAAMGAFLVPWPLVIVAFMLAVALGTVGGLLNLWLAARRESSSSQPSVVSSQWAEDSGAGLASSAQGSVGNGQSPDGTAAAEIQISEAGHGAMSTALHAHSPGLAEAADPTAHERGDSESALTFSSQPSAPTPQHLNTSTPDSDITTPDPETELEVPALPPSSRWGRLWTVLGTWVAVGAVWGGAALASGSPLLGILAGVLGGAAAAGILWIGIRQWVRGDQEWLPAMDQLFEEGDPGPRFIPFGPYLVAGTLLAMLFGRAIVEWYVTRMLALSPGFLASMGWD
jgi:leader peptidase (prepilin peptidase) / N-methyltransferase